jgi:signal transduction histidine kinase
VKLSTRLLLQGAGIPGVLLIASYFAVALLLDYVLHQGIDQGLLTQAAVESVSLFDTPGHGPHLHLGESPLADRVRGFAAVGAVYDEAGQVVVVHPEGAAVPSTLRPAQPGTPAILTTTEDPIPRREVTVSVADSEGHRYVLWLGVSLEAHNRTLQAYWKIAGACLAAALVLLISIATYAARTVSGRARALADHMLRLRDGDFDAQVPADDARDVISELRDSVAETTERLRAGAESRDRFIADAAHELRTPLAALRTGIDVTLRRERDADELRTALVAARAEAQRLEALASSLLDLAAVRRTAFDARRADLRSLLEDAVEAARAVAESRDIVIELDAPAQAPAKVAAVQLRQALDNLIANAIAHGPAGAPVRVSLQAADGGWLIRVTDRGQGVRPEDRERIFEPFHRLDQARPGTGLGLAIVREVAHRHGGEVWVQAGDEGGAEFCLRLAPGEPLRRRD